MSCRQHHFNNIDTRCSVCGMRRGYQYECLATLNSWPNENKKDPVEHWQEKVDAIRFCKPHEHSEGVG